MKCIFLDIDGVLNSIKYDREKSEGQGNIDESRLPLLRELVEKTQALIVLTSTWRKHWDRDAALCDETGREIASIFAKHGLSIYDKTIYKKVSHARGNIRADEVRAWLEEHGGVESFVIIDDIALGWGEDLQDHLVQTNERIGYGLEEKHIKAAEEILKCE